ncbi:MAG: GspH/FimT family pseudopilin [Acinetobacter sp.]
MQKNRGFTLIELMVTIAVLAIIATMAAPAFGDLVTQQKLNSSARELVMAINQAKSQAALVKKSVGLCLGRTQSDSDFTKTECATATIPEYTATNPGPPVVPVLSNDQKAEVIKSRIISVQIDAGVTIGSTSATSILLSDIGSTSTAQAFSFCKSGKQKTISVSKLGIVSQTSGTC